MDGSWGFKFASWPRSFWKKHRWNTASGGTSEVLYEKESANPGQGPHVTSKEAQLFRSFLRNRLIAKASNIRHAVLVSLPHRFDVFPMGSCPLAPRRTNREAFRIGAWISVGSTRHTEGGLNFFKLRSLAQEMTAGAREAARGAA